MDDLLRHLVEVCPFSELTLSVITKCFLDFCLLGGMPAVIAEFIRNRSFEGVLDLQRQILDGYRGDVRKYAEDFLWHPMRFFRLRHFKNCCKLQLVAFKNVSAER